MMDRDFGWKVVVGGQGGVGKTTILHRFLWNEFLKDTKMTIGVQFHTLKMVRQNKMLEFIMWDLGGQERFRFMFDGYVKGAVAGFILFDMARIGTLLAVPEWVELFKKNMEPKSPIILVGTKTDLVNDDDLKTINIAANKMVEEHGLVAYIPTSAKWGFNVTETITYLADCMLHAQYQSESENIERK